MGKGPKPAAALPQTSQSAGAGKNPGALKKAYPVAKKGKKQHNHDTDVEECSTTSESDVMPPPAAAAATTNSWSSKVGARGATEFRQGQYRPTRLLHAKFLDATGRVLPNFVPFLPYDLDRWSEDLYVSTLFLSYKDPASAFYGERFQFKTACQRFRSITLLSTENGQLAVFEGRIKKEEKQKESWREGFEIVSPPTPPSQLVVGTKTINVPSVSSFKFVSSVDLPCSTAVKVKHFTKTIDGNVVELPATWLVGPEVWINDGIPSNILLDQHSTHAHHLATFNFSGKISTSEIEKALSFFKNKYDIRFLHRSNSIRAYSEAPFTPEFADKLHSEKMDVTISFDTDLPTTVSAIISTTLQTPFTPAFVQDLHEAFSFKIPHGYTATKLYAVFKSTAALEEAARVLGQLSIAVSPYVKGQGSAEADIT